MDYKEYYEIIAKISEIAKKYYPGGEWAGIEIISENVFRFNFVDDEGEFHSVDLEF